MDNFYVKRDVIRATKFMRQEGQFNYYPSEELRAHVLQVTCILLQNFWQGLDLTCFRHLIVYGYNQ